MTNSPEEGKGTSAMAGPGGSALVSGDVADKDGKRKRVQRACDACRKKKIRCEGSPGNPCPTCKNNGLDCTFQELSKKRGPPKGYVEQLERRLETMERLLRSLAPGLEIFSAPDAASSRDLTGAIKPGPFDADTTDPSLGMPPPGALPDNRDSTSSDGIDIDVVEDVDSMTSDFGEMTIERGRYMGKASGFQLGRTIMAYRNQTHDQPLPADPHEDPHRPTFAAIKGPTAVVETVIAQEGYEKSARYQLPPNDVVLSLAEHYFKISNTTAPILHWPSFKRDVLNGRAERDPPFRGLCFAVISNGARFAGDTRYIPENLPESTNPPSHTIGLDFFRAAWHLTTPFLLPASLSDLQSLVMQCMFLMNASSPINAWACLGFAIRRAQDIGAHRRLSSRWAANPLEDQLRKRAWWSLYYLDRFLSSCLGRPLAAYDEDIDLDLPLDLEDDILDEWSMERPNDPPPAPSDKATSMRGFLCMINLSKIIGKALKTVYAINREHATRHDPYPQWEQRIVAELDSDLNAWLETVPKHLRWAPSSQDNLWLVQSAMLFSAYYITQILVHRDFLSPDRKGLLKFPSLAICTNAARSCSHVLDVLRRRGGLARTSATIPFHALTAGMTLLVHAFARRNNLNKSLSDQTSHDVNKCMEVLRSLSEISYLAFKAQATLRTLADISDIPTNERSHKRRTRDDDEEEAPPNSASDRSPKAGSGSSESPRVSGDEMRDGPQQRKKRKEENISSNERKSDSPSNTSILPFTTEDLSQGPFGSDCNMYGVDLSAFNLAHPPGSQFANMSLGGSFPGGIGATPTNDLGFGNVPDFTDSNGFPFADFLAGNHSQPPASSNVPMLPGNVRAAYPSSDPSIMSPFAFQMAESASNSGSAQMPLPPASMAHAAMAASTGIDPSVFNNLYGEDWGNTLAMLAGFGGNNPNGSQNDEHGNRTS